MNKRLFLEDCLSLWVPYYPEQEPSEKHDLLDKHHITAQSLQDYLNGKIGFREYLEICSQSGADMDEYLQLVDADLSANGI
jgi:hypothetical protein